MVGSFPTSLISMLMRYVSAPSPLFLSNQQSVYLLIPKQEYDLLVMDDQEKKKKTTELKGNGNEMLKWEWQLIHTSNFYKRPTTVTCQWRQRLYRLDTLETHVLYRDRQHNIEWPSIQSLSDENVKTSNGAPRSSHGLIPGTRLPSSSETARISVLVQNSSCWLIAAPKQGGVATSSIRRFDFMTNTWHSPTPLATQHAHVAPSIVFWRPTGTCTYPVRFFSSCSSR
jgi:hypothetical protein